ncbi:hypothetical protein Bca4012_085563 [Brassica carinata]
MSVFSTEMTLVVVVAAPYLKCTLGRWKNKLESVFGMIRDFDLRWRFNTFFVVGLGTFGAPKISGTMF